MATLPTFSRGSVFSFGSVFSAASLGSITSVGSAASILAIGSAVSVLSAVSVASVLSVASITSVLSIASSGSVLSIASTDCGMFTFYTKCLPTRLHVVETEFELHFGSDAWNTMSNCTKVQYKSGNRPEWCDYQQIDCTFLGASGHNVTDKCEVRRKGSSTWRDLAEKPSFKIKFDGNVDFGEFECGKNCPPGESSNVWKTKKVTLQNQVIADGEIDAYNLFRKFIAAPLAVQTRVRLFKEGVLFREDTYVMLETIDDKKFLKKWFGDTAVLYELDNDSNGHIAKFERYIESGDEISRNYVNRSQITGQCSNETFRYDNGYDDEEECVDDEVEKGTEAALESPEHLKTLLDIGFSDMDRYNVMHYYAGEVATNHWDAVCSEQTSNTYVVFNGSTHFYVPSGTDETFQCPDRRAIMGWSSSEPQCPSLKECYKDASCRRDAENIVENVKLEKERDPNDACPNIAETIGISVVVPLFSTLLLVALYYAIKSIIVFA